MKATKIAMTATMLLASMVLAAPSAAAASPTSTTNATSASGTLDPRYVLAELVGGPGIQTSVAPAAMQAKAKAQGASADQLAAIAAASGCWSGNYWVQGKNLLGWVIFQYNEDHDWCGGGTWVTYTDYNTYPSNLFLGVGYSGDSAHSTYGKGWNVWKEHFSGHFTALNTPWVTAYNYYPWMEFEVGGGGQRYWEDTWGGASCGKPC